MEKEKSVKLQSGWRDRHPTVMVDGVEGCGYSWCIGECGLPAIVSPDRTMKVYGSMVAIGRVMQEWRVSWTGEMIPLSEEQNDILKDWYWW